MPKGKYLSLEKEKENFCVVLTYLIKRASEIRKFHVAVVQQQLRNVQKSKLHVQGCCYARRNLLHFCRSYCHCRHYCSSSLLFCFCDITLLSIEFNWKPKCSYFLIDFTSTSLTWRKSLASKDTAAPCTGESSSMLPSYAMFVLTANATCFD